jgi:hypothetical protein
MMHHQKTGARAIYRQQEGQRIQESITLADKFQKLKSLKVTLAFFGPEGVSKSSEIKYTVNLTNAKSVFRFNCQNNECIRGDFDLSEELAKAVAARRKLITGELCCQGWRDKTTINTLACRNILRYKLNLTF